MFRDSDHCVAACLTQDMSRRIERARLDLYLMGKVPALDLNPPTGLNSMTKQVDSCMT